MLALGFLLVLFGIGFLCWLMFALATLALPLFVGVTAAITAYHHDAGLILSGLVALAAAALTLAAGQIAFTRSHQPLTRILVALIFAVPAAWAGYCAGFGLLHLLTSANLWCSGFGVVSGLLVGCSAAVRLTAQDRAVHTPSRTTAAA